MTMWRCSTFRQLITIRNPPKCLLRVLECRVSQLPSSVWARTKTPHQPLTESKCQDVSMSLIRRLLRWSRAIINWPNTRARTLVVTIRQMHALAQTMNDQALTKPSCWLLASLSTSKVISTIWMARMKSRYRLKMADFCTSKLKLWQREMKMKTWRTWSKPCKEARWKMPSDQLSSK